ncbi:uncharacterized protein TrAtP1_009939 [Trichoderma atroviride]|uniref:uncharacterized protein n=1 Tax=Hypocrea atroviridis TaxID=63577 RepID=UPI0033164D43|nr:hypothetical protein TrAtP1_009939 [Trichoderma atroviride]
MKALILACRKGSSYRQISENTIAAVFFGVLQRAQISEPWDRQILNLFSVSPLRVYTFFSSTSKDFSDVLYELSESFSNISGPYKLFNVFEQPKSTTRPTVVISQYSATNDAVVSENFGAARVHTDLCDIHDGDPLAEWLKLKLNNLEHIMDETTAISDLYHGFIRALAKIDPNLQHIIIPETTPASGSMEWVKTHSGFNQWANTEEIGFLHICESLGSGATVLASHIVGVVREKDAKKEMYFLGFSFDNGDVYGSSMETMILSFICQLLSQRPTLFRHIVRLAMWITQRECSNKKTLWVLFWSLISHIENGQLVITIQAIQESSSPVNEIVDQLYSLRGLPKLGVKIIITSDYENGKSDLLGQCLLVQHLHTIWLESDEDTNLSVKELVRSRIDRLLESRASCKDLGDMIMDYLWSSTPSFYWVTAKIDVLEAQLPKAISSRRTLLEKLEHFPSTIDELFKVMVQRIPLDYINWIQPGKGLSWIMYALRPLTSSEFAVAAAFDQFDASTTLKLDEFGDTISSDLPGDINRIAGPWVKVEDGRINIVNTALKAVLLAQYPEDESFIETMLLLKCIRYLDWVDLRVGNDQSREESCESRNFRNSTEFDFVPYASVYWPDHFQRAAPVSSDVLEEVLAFLENKLQFWSSLARKHQPNLLSLDVSESPLKTAASLGLTQVVERMLSYIEKPISEEKETLIQESMMLAIEHGHSKIALRLYEMQSFCKAPQLHKAASGGFNELLRGFLEFDLVKASIDSYNAFGYTPLHYAAQHGHADTVNLLLENGASANLVSDDGTKTTALHLAVRVADLDIIKALIQRGADATARESSGYNAVALSAEGGFDELIRFFMTDYINVQMVQDTIHGGNKPLHLAAMYGHTSMCKFLVQQQADVKAVNGNDETPLLLAAKGEFWGTVGLLLNIEKQSRGDPKKTREISSNGEESETEAVDGASTTAEGYVQSAKALLDKTTATDPVDSEGNTALHLASRHGHAELVCVLLDSEKFSKDLPNEGGMTAMHLAAREGYTEAVAIILEHEGSAEITNADGDTPMHIAAAKGYINVVELLCAKNPSIRYERNSDNETPLILAAKRGHVAAVKKLLHVSGSGSKQNGSTEVWGDFYPLHSAALEGYDELVRLLVAEEKYNVNIRRDSDQQTPIHAAMQNKSATMISLLIHLGADVTAADEDRDTALHLAASMNHLEACQTLLSHMSDSGIEAIDLSNNENETPLYRTCCFGHTDVAKLLLDNGADCNKHCTEGCTPLHIAAFLRNLNVVRLLLDKTADYNALADIEATPIMLAAQEGHADVTAMLFEAGAAVDMVDSKGSTALHYAAWDGHLDCVEFLVEKGHVDYSLPRKDGRTPLHLAAVDGHVDVAKYLLEKGAQLSVTAETFGTPLECAIKGGQLEVVKLLVGKGAATTMDMSEPASWGKNIMILDFAQKHPLNFNIALSTYMLQQAIILPDNNLALDLLEKITDVNEECEPYKTVLQAAAWKDATSVMEKLLLKGADPNIKGGEYGSALHAAIEGRNVRSVKLLLEHGADPAIEHKGEGAIFPAFRVGKPEVVTALLDKMDSTARAAKDRNGRSLLACAIGVKNKDIGDYLISMNLVPIQDKDLYGRTPLMEAVLSDNADMVKTLLRMGADPNASDTERKTPLIRAITSHSINQEIVTALLEHPRLDPELEDCRGRSYNYWAARLGLERDVIESGVNEYARFSIKWLRFSLVLQAAIASGKESIIKSTIANMNTRNKHLTEPDGDGWTASYTTTRYQLEGMYELKDKLKDLFRPLTVQEPRNWHEEDKSPCLQVSDEGKLVTVMSSPGNPSYHFQTEAVIRADHAMPGNQLYYFEIEVMEGAKDKVIGVGFCEECAVLDRMLGSNKGSWGYHGGDGYTCSSSSCSSYGPQYSKEDVVGCGVDFDKGVAFFTLNGKYLGIAFRGIKGKLYPAVSFDFASEGCRVLANFGQKQFLFDVSKWNAEEALAKPPQN